MKKSSTDHVSTDATNLPVEQPYIAKPMTRLVALLYDGMLILALLLFVAAILIFLGTNLTTNVGSTAQEAHKLPTWYQNFILTPSLVATLMGFYGLFWRRSGQTLGMQTWRLKTVGYDGQLLTWGQTAWRILSACVVPILCMLMASLLHHSRKAMLVSVLLGFLFNYGFCWFNRRGLAVHDILSNTLTLKMPKIHHDSVIVNFLRSRVKKDNLME